MEINNLIKRKRQEKGLTMKELADMVGVSEGTISRWESGEISNIKRKNAASLAKILDVKPAQILGLNDSVEYVGTVEVMQSYKFIEDPIAAGSPEEIIGQTEYKTIQIPNQFLGKYAGNKDIIIMQVNGNSMNKIIPDDSLIGILP